MMRLVATNDVNGDGRPEFFITAGFLITVNSQLQLAQRTYIYSGNGAQLLASFDESEPFPDLAPPPAPASSPPQSNGLDPNQPVLQPVMRRLAADLDGDGDVDDADLEFMLRRFGQPTCCRILADLDGDGLVADTDIIALLRSYGQTGGAVRGSGDVNGDGAANNLDIQLVVDDVNAGLSPLVDDVTRDGFVDIEDAVQIAVAMSSQSGAAPVPIGCDPFDGFLSVDEMQGLCGSGGVLDPVLPPPDGQIPGAGSPCDNLPQQTAHDCILYAKCVGADEFDAQFDALKAQEKTIEDAWDAVVAAFEAVESGPLRVALDSAIATRDAAEVKAIAAADKEARKLIHRAAVSFTVIESGAGALLGVGVIVVAIGSGPLGWAFISGAAIGALVEGTLTANNIEDAHADFEADVAAIEAAGDGVNTGAVVNAAVVATGISLVAARSAFNAALFAAQGIVDQTFADLDQQFNALDAQVKALKDQKDARIADVLITCLSNLPAP